MSELLEVTDVATWFETDRGLVHAVDGVSFALERGRTLGIVGESGSGKTVLSRSIMGLLPKSDVVREGSIVFEPALMIFFTVLALNLLGDAIRARFDVRETAL